MFLGSRNGHYLGPMGLRIAAIGILLLAAYVARVTLGLGIAMAGLLFGDEWLGPEPEMLYLVAGGLLVALFVWLGVRLWRQGGGSRRGTRSPNLGA